MTTEKREQLIDRLDRSFKAMPRWAQGACIHAMAVPTINPATLAPFVTFREMLESAPAESLEILKDDFEGNGDLMPAQEVS